MKGRNILLFVICVAVGIAISMQSKVTRGSYEFVSAEIVADDTLAIAQETAEIEQLYGLIEEASDKLNSYEISSNSGIDIKNPLLTEIESLKTYSGLKDMEGEGVIVVIDDGTRDLFEGEDPSNIIVHDIDILTIVNDLKIAGAEVVSINGERILDTTEVNCSGHTVRINNKFSAQPFIIKAIGNPKMLHAAITAPGTYGELLREYGLILKVNKSLNLKIRKHTEGIEYRYLQPYEEIPHEVS